MVNSTDDSLRDELYKQAIAEAQLILKPPVTDVTDVKIKQTSIGLIGTTYELKNKWQNRIEPAFSDKKLVQQDKSTPIITYKCNAKDINIINTFDTVYSIVGDHLSAIPSQHCSYFCGINHSKYLKSKNTIIYYGALTGKTKLCQKIWAGGDIRSYMNIDSSIYKPYFDPLNGVIPSIVGASILYVKNKFSHKPVIVYGIDIHELPVVDQRIIGDLNISICG